MNFPLPPIYISYAWGQRGSEEESVVNTLCLILLSLGYEIVRDRDYLKYLDNLPIYFKRVGTGGYVIAIVGEKYLHSENCMTEASYMAHKGNLDISVFPITLSSLKGIYGISSRNQLINDLQQYWQQIEKQLEKALNERNYPQGFKSAREDLSLITQLTSYLSEFIHHIGTTLQISAKEHLDENFGRLIGALKNRIEEDFKEIKKSIGQKNTGISYHQRFSSEYVGRKENIDDVLKFLNDIEQHFMLLYGVGGMGKSHLIDICRKSFENPLLLHEECTENYNLKSLFKTCKINYPQHLETPEERRKYFLDEFCQQNIFLILDDFYETTDFEIRGMLPKMASIPSGKILLVSRAVPKELENIGFSFFKYIIPSLNKQDFIKVIQNYIDLKRGINEFPRNKELTIKDYEKIFEKAQGYPLGGQLIIDLVAQDDLDSILKDLPKFEAEKDEEGKKFSGRLLDNIFKKGNPKEIDLLTQFSALFGTSSKELIRKLPAFNQSAFDALVNRRNFIWQDEIGLFNSHAMIKDYAYDKLIEKPIVHKQIGEYFENKLFNLGLLDSIILESAILHYKRVSLFELNKFGQRVDGRFNIGDVKSLIKDNVKDTIRNYKSLIEVYPDKMAYYNELGIAYRLDNQNQLAIDTFLKAIDVDPNALPSYNELGITYREAGKNQLAIDTFLKRLELEPNEVRSLNELGITYREAGLFQEAIKTCYDTLDINPRHSPTVLNLLQIFIFFQPDKGMAIKYYERLDHPPYHSSFKNNRKSYKIFIDNLPEILNLQSADFKMFDKYMFFSIQYKAYQTILPLLVKLNDKFPENSKIVSRLGKTLSNQTIKRNEKGWIYLKEVIELFKKENNIEKHEEHIYYYLYNLLNNERMDLLAEELETYKQYIRDKPKYYRFLARISESSNKSFEEIVARYEEALKISDTKKEELNSVEAYLDYLTKIDLIQYQSKIEMLKTSLSKLLE